MVGKRAALIFMMFSLNILFTSSSLLQRSSTLVEVQEGIKGRRMVQEIDTDRKHTEQSIEIEFAGGHVGAVNVHEGTGGGHGGTGVGGGGHGGGSGSGEGEGGSSSTTTPGSASVVPIYGAAAAAKSREHQTHKGGGVHSHSCNLGILTTPIFFALSFFF